MNTGNTGTNTGTNTGMTGGSSGYRRLSGHPSDMKICKPVISECPGTSVCLCNSDTPVVVFDSNRLCVCVVDFEVKSFSLMKTVIATLVFIQILVDALRKTTVGHNI